VEGTDEEDEEGGEGAVDAGHTIRVADVQRGDREPGLLTILQSQRTIKWRMQPAIRRWKAQSHPQRRMKLSRTLSQLVRRMELKLNEFQPFGVIGAQPVD
jgi:hypothetical protein